jgi:hypothetical protein
MAMLAMIFDFLAGLFVTFVMPWLSQLAVSVLNLLQIGLDALVTLPSGARYRVRRETVMV